MGNSGQTHPRVVAEAVAAVVAEAEAEAAVGRPQRAAARDRECQEALECSRGAG